MADVPFLGMRASDDFITNARPENWREMLLYLYPNGAASLTAMTAMMKTESTDDPHYHWFTKQLPTLKAACTGVFTTSAMNVAYATGASAGTTLYFRMSATDVDKIRLGHQVMMRCSVDPSLDVVGKVTARAKNGASSYVAVYLHEADDNSIQARTLSACDVVKIIGNINPEGGTIPSSIRYDPVEYYNYTQIFRTSLAMTRTAKRTRLRTGNQVEQARKEALELHGIEMENAFIFGKRTLSTGDNGHPERTTGGIREFITTNRFNYPADGGGAWLTDGWDYLMEKLRSVFRFGDSRERIGYCGNGVLLAVAQLAKEYGTFELTAMKTVFGIEIFEWITPFGRLFLKDHPLFNHDDTLNYSMLVVQPSNLIYRYIDDTKYYPNRQANDLDGEQSEYLSEAGLELHHEETFAWFDGLGLNTWGTLTTAAPTTLAPTTTAPTTV